AGHLCGDAAPPRAGASGGGNIVAEGLEEGRAELAKELAALLREPPLRLAGELLPEAAHRLARRARRDGVPLREHDVAGAEERQVVRDRRTYRACAGNDDSSHRSSSVRSASVSVRSGRRTSGPIGTPRAATTTWAAAWNGTRSSAVRTGPRSAPPGSRTAATTSSGNADASADTAPTAPPASPCGISASGPTKTSRPSSRYGANCSHGVSDTLRPPKFAASPASCPSTESGTAYPLRAANSYT